MNNDTKDSLQSDSKKILRNLLEKLQCFLKKGIETTSFIIGLNNTAQLKKPTPLITYQKHTQPLRSQYFKTLTVKQLSDVELELQTQQLLDEIESCLET